MQLKTMELLLVQFPKFLWYLLVLSIDFHNFGKLSLKAYYLVEIYSNIRTKFLWVAVVRICYMELELPRLTKY